MERTAFCGLFAAPLDALPAPRAGAPGDHGGGGVDEGPRAEVPEAALYAWALQQADLGPDEVGAPAARCMNGIAPSIPRRPPAG